MSQLQENQLFANRYRLLKRLGSGAFSEVWKAEDIKAGNLKVAVKIYAPDKGLDEDGIAIFSREFTLVYNVNHQNLLKPTNFDDCNGSPFLVLPFCERGSVTKLIGNFDNERDIAHFIHDVAAGLEYLHSQEPPIIHQDIKPDNILIDAQGNYCITDFGISTRIRSTLRRSVNNVSSAGTMAYMAPERFTGDRQPIKASDIWSLGATIFEMIKGDVPLGDYGGMTQQNDDLPGLKGKLSEGLRNLIFNCMRKEPWKRPTATELKKKTENYLEQGVWEEDHKYNPTQKPSVSHDTRKTQMKNDYSEPNSGPTPTPNSKRWLYILFYVLIIIGGLIIVFVIIQQSSRDTVFNLPETLTQTPTPTQKTSNSLVDVEGNVYQTVTIGTQTWMSENLKTTKYNDGTNIPNVTGDAAWAALTTGAYCWYDNDISNKATHGALYNRYAVKTEKLCPKGWHVPSDAEWSTLTDFVGGKDIAGKKLKATKGWRDNGNGTDEYGFIAFPGGYRSSYYGGSFGMGYSGYWWSSTEYSTDNTYYWGMTDDYDNVSRSYDDYSCGFCVRCLRN